MDAAWLMENPLEEPPQDLEVLKSDETVDVVITDTKPPSDERIKQGSRSIQVVLRAVDSGGRMLKSIRHFVNFPKPDDDAEKVNNKKIAIRDFYECFSIPPSAQRPMDHEAWRGAQGKVIVDIESDEQYGERNHIKRFLR